MTFENLVCRARTMLSYGMTEQQIIDTFIDEQIEPATAVFATKGAAILIKETAVI